mmetsp:Transcript_103987/g.335209  ORF Transcript_103987/g.335209 Transcript_103987/m.335209 type:complete len:264 (-) Transcript_103987:24-815(-)
MVAAAALRRTRPSLAGLALCFAAASLSRGVGDVTFAQSAAASAVQPALDTLRGAVALGGTKRPDEQTVLSAILSIQRQRPTLNAEEPFFGKLSGGGREGGKRWRLVYLATKNAVVSARKGVAPPSFFDRGWYVDGIVTAVQRFEDSPSCRVNQNGVFGLLGLGGFFFGYVARFKWPSPQTRTTMAFQPLSNDIKAFGQTFSSPFSGFPAGPQGDGLFEAARVQDLNIFNFFFVNDHVAVAQGASGSVAVWGATDPQWDSEHLG